MSKFEVKPITVTSVGNKSVDADGVKSAMFKDDAFYTSSMSMRKDAQITVGDRFVLVVNDERKQPFALYREEGNEWIFSTQSEDYDRWPVWAKLFSLLPLSSFFILFSIVETFQKSQWALLYSERKFILRRRLYLVVSILHLILSLVAISLPLIGWVEWSDATIVLIAHGLSNMFSAIRYDEIYKDLYEINLMDAQSAIDEYLESKNEQV